MPVAGWAAGLRDGPSPLYLAVPLIVGNVVTFGPADRRFGGVSADTF